MTNGGINKNETLALPRRYSFSTIICLTTKSGEFVID